MKVLPFARYRRKAYGDLSWRIPIFGGDAGSFVPKSQEPL